MIVIERPFKLKENLQPAKVWNIKRITNFLLYFVPIQKQWFFMLMLWKDASKYFRNGLREQNSNSWYILWIQSFNFRYHFGIYCNAIWFVRNRVVLPGVIVRIPWITILINYFIFSDFLREIKNISRIFWYYPYWCPKHFWLSNIRMVSVIFCYKIIIMFIKAWSQEWAILITITFVDSLLPWIIAKNFWILKTSNVRLFKSV